MIARHLEAVLHATSVSDESVDDLVVQYEAIGQELENVSDVYRMAKGLLNVTRELRGPGGRDGEVPLEGGVGRR